MEITFQNKVEDFQAFYDYMIRNTEQGKAISKQVFRDGVIRGIVLSMLFGSIIWGISGDWRVGLGITALLFIGGEFFNLMISKFDPLYHSGIQIYKKQENTISQIELQVFRLPRTITLDDTWLEMRSSEAVHHWRWRRVDKIGLTPNFIFIHVGNCPVVYVPKRDFSSEQSFIEFGKKLVMLKEKNKDQAIGGE